MNVKKTQAWAEDEKKLQTLVFWNMSGLALCFGFGVFFLGEFDILVGEIRFVIAFRLLIPFT